MEPYTFRIPWKPLSWNALVHKNRWIVQRIKEDARQAVWVAVKREKKIVFESFPISLHVHCRWKQKRVHDIDSIAFKYCLDAFVDLGILPDDNLEYVESVTYTGERGADADEIVVTFSTRN